jgi:predicted SprT family Zn-dependent metalloprotease
MNYNKILYEVSEEAKAINIPISDQMVSKVIINNRAKRRLGRCIKRNSSFFIEISSRLKTEDKVREVLIHEILHTCPNCQNHKSIWKNYVIQMNTRYGYKVNPSPYTKISIEDCVPYKYTIVCENCNNEWHRDRYSKLVKHPEQFRCSKCNGRLKLK